jgi:hypothetical protein
MGVPLIYLASGVAFCFTAGIQLATRNLDVFVWVVVRAGSPNISFFVAMPASKNRQEFCHKNFPKYVRRIEQLDGSALLHYVIVTDAATGAEVNQQ